MGSAFYQLFPRYSGTLIPNVPMAIRLWETFTFSFLSHYRQKDFKSSRNIEKTDIKVKLSSFRGSNSVVFIFKFPF